MMDKKRLQPERWPEPDDRPVMPPSRPFSFDRRRFMAGAASAALLATTGGVAAPLLTTRPRHSTQGLNSWVEVDPAKFKRNLELIQEILVDDVKICAVMKADAYGAGIDLLIRHAIRVRIPYVGIASNDEARIVRGNGFKGKLMRVRVASSSEMAGALQYDIEELVGSLDKARELARVACGSGHPARVHLALNSGGMSRHGLELGADAGWRVAEELVTLEGLRVVGLMTHFPVEDETEVRQGVETFKENADWLFANTALRREDVLLHAANSFAVQNVPEAHLDMVRPGGALYGYSGTPKPPFAHVISFKTRVASVQAYQAGNTVSYDREFKLERDSLLANLPVGYSDGYGRAYSNKGVVLIRGKRAPVIGRVTMNTTMVDVTDIPGVEYGDEVVLFGKQGEDELTQAELQCISGLGLAEQYTAWGALNPKVVLNRSGFSGGSTF